MQLLKFTAQSMDNELILLYMKMKKKTLNKIILKFVKNLG